MIINLGKLKLLISLVVLSGGAFSIGHLYYKSAYTWGGVLPKQSSSNSGWQQRDGAISSDSVQYYRAGRIVMDEHMNFIKEAPYCGLKETIFGGTFSGKTKYYDFSGQIVKLKTKCYGPSGVIVFSPVSVEGKLYISSLLDNGIDIVFAEAILSEKQEMLERLVPSPSPPPVLSSKGYGEAIFQTTEEGEAIAWRQRQSDRKQKEQKWTDAKESAL